MGCELRTIRAGSAALGLSVVVASVTWQSVLLLFMATGMGFSVWSFLKDRKKLDQKDLKAKAQVSDEPLKSTLKPTLKPLAGNRQDRHARIYQFRYPMAAAWTND